MVRYCPGQEVGGSRGDVLGWVRVRRKGREEGMEGSLQFQVRQEGNLEF